MADSTSELNYPDRAAPALFRGILYQLLWSAIRALDLQPNEVLVLEGDEDLVKKVLTENGEVIELTHEQIKALSTRLSARHGSVYKTIFAFLCSFHTHTSEGRKCTFVFTTNESRAKQRIGLVPTENRLDIDVLSTWSQWTKDDTALTEKLKKNVRHLVNAYVDTAYPKPTTGKKGPEASITAALVREAVSFLENPAFPTRWSDFFEAVAWNLDQPEPQRLRNELITRVTSVTRMADVPAELTDLLVDRFVMTMLRVSAKPDPKSRQFTRIEAAKLLTLSHKNLVTWAARVHPKRLWDMAVDGRLGALEAAVFGTVQQDLSPATRAQFVKWVVDDTKTFRVPGFEKPIDIQHIWQLDASQGREVFHANLLLETGFPLIALLGDGGAGKSTLLRAIAHQEATAGRLILKIRLPHVREYRAKGASFTLALTQVVRDYANTSETEARAVINAVNVILADGLDECFAEAGTLVDELTSFANARGDVRIVVACRDSHSRVLPNSFTRCRLMPLTEYAQHAATQSILRSLGAPQDQIDTAIFKAPQILSGAKLDATPLNLLIACQLAFASSPSRQTRTALFEGLFESLRTRQLCDRDCTPVEAELAADVLSALAVRQLEIPNEDSAALRSWAVRQVGIVGPAGIPRIDKAVQFWVHRSILTRSYVSNVERLTFTHDLLRAFAAAQWIASRHPRERMEWFSRFANQQQATTVFAVGLGNSDSFLELSTSLPDAHDTLLLLATAATELAKPAPQVLNRLASLVTSSLTSPVPLTALEAVDILLPLLPLAPELFATASLPALNSPGEWNVLAAMCVLVATDAPQIPTDRLLALLSAYIRRNGSPDSRSHDFEIEARLWHHLFVPATEHLVLTRRSDVQPLIADAVLSGNRVSMAIESRLVARLGKWGFDDLRTAYRDKRKTTWHRTDRREFRGVAADVAFLYLLITSLGVVKGDRRTSPNSPSVRRLIGNLNFTNSPTGNWDAGLFLGEKRLRTIIRGVVAASKLDASVVVAEAAEALELLLPLCEQSPLPESRLLLQEIVTPEQLNWTLTQDLELSLDDLFGILNLGGSLFPRHALLLLLHHRDVAEVRSRLEQQLLVSESFVLDETVECASLLFGEDAGNVIERTFKRRFAGSTARLLPALAKLEPGSARTQHYVSVALQRDDVDSARSASEAAAFCQAPSIQQQLKPLLDLWAERSLLSLTSTSWKAADSVVSAILNTLVRCNRLDLEQAKRLTTNKAVQRDAAKYLVVHVCNNPTLVSQIIEDIKTEELPPITLEFLLEQPSPMLAPHAGALGSLTCHASETIRGLVTSRALGNATWIERKQAEALLRARLDDVRPTIRTDAQRALEGKPPPHGLARVLRP
jgi:ABC-type dipeptide/oligopeptide/nickel transport system ATPase subunit